ncbi:MULTISPECIES: transposase [unclassified Aureimonas]|uniref:transposase n=1 Tax=unclassified Aureimonas TaxID=2615206 RepID=UPI00237815CB|nr:MULTISPECIES: transposase [unclassified Aureimonas]
MNAELDEHLEWARADAKPNRRNGSSKTTMLTDASKIDLTIPRDRTETFDP